METDKLKEQRWLEYVQAKERKNKSANRICICIQLGIIGLMIACIIFCWQYAPIFLVWFFLNGLAYSRGCSWLCIDEYDLEDSRYGLRMMLKSWKFQLPMHAIATVLICIAPPIIIVIYSVIALFIYFVVVDFIFN